MPLQIIHNNITEMQTDAIVNAANTNLWAGGGVCGAIFKKAASFELNKECLKLAPIKTGEAVITNGYHLLAKKIIHAVGPIYKDGNHNEAALLESAYLNALKLAVENNCHSIAFPLISSGIYGYPKTEALQVAVDTIGKFLMQDDLDVYIVVFERESVQISNYLYDNVSHYIHAYYEEKEQSCSMMSSKSCEETFIQMLVRLINEKGYKDCDVYRRANIDRKLFSKICTDKDYYPEKKTIFALSIALNLSLAQTNELLNKAGYSLLNNSKLDVIVKYFIENNEYDIYTINNVLFYFQQPLLG